MTSTTSRPQRAARPWGAGALVSRLDSPVTSYYVLVGATAVLVVIGLVMVLSASMVTSYQDDGSSFAVFIKQAQFAVIGLVATVVAARLPVAWWKRLALPALVGSLLLQVLVFTPLGVTVNGNRNWLRFSSALSFQPSELTKLGLVLVGALVFANKGRHVRTLHQIVVPYLVPISLVTIGLVLLGHDLGTALVLIGIVGAVLWAAGVPSRFFLATAAAAALGGRPARRDERHPDGPDHQLAERLLQRPRRCVRPVGPRALRPGRRRLVGRGPRSQQGEVGLAR